MGAVDLREIVSQVTEVLRAHGMGVSSEQLSEQVQQHIQLHVLSPKVTMHHVLSELRVLSRVTQSACVHDREDGARHVDAKALALHLKLVDRIIAVHRLHGVARRGR